MDLSVLLQPAAFLVLLAIYRCESHAFSNRLSGAVAGPVEAARIAEVRVVQGPASRAELPTLGQPIRAPESSSLRTLL